MDWLTINNITYEHQQIESRAADYVSFYKSLLKRGDLVLIILKESIDLFSSFLGALSNRQVPAYFAYPSEKQTKEFFIESIKNLLKYNDIKLVVTYDEVKEILSDFDLDIININNIPYISSEIDSIYFDDDSSFIQFSSGTTGAKKSVKVTYKSLTNQLSSYIKHLDLYDDSVIVSWLPHYHDMGLIACMLLPYLTSTRLIMMSPFDWVKNPKILLEAIEKYKGTHIWLPNFSLGHMCNNIKNQKQYDLSSLKMITLCSEPVLENTLNKFIQKFNIKENIFYNCYAMAENTFAVTTTTNGRIKFKNGVACTGTPIDDNYINIIDDEIIISSNCLVEGYFNNIEKTNDSFIASWYKTGDCGFIEDGELYVNGRINDLIIVGGENIFATDIEEILNNTVGLKPGRSVVFGITDDVVGTERIVILAESIVNGHVNVSQIRKKCMNILNISISEIIILPPKSLYKSTAGKISRTINKDAYMENKFNIYKKQPIKYKNVILNFIYNEILVDKNIKLKNNTKLISSGLIDSFSVVLIIAFIEKEFNIILKPENVNLMSFETINKIEKLIKEQL